MNIITALELVRDLSAPFSLFVGALEYLNLYREGNYIVDYCSILEQCVYVELDAQTLRYLDLLSV